MLPVLKVEAIGLELLLRTNLGSIYSDSKKGKLPGDKVEISYALEYGEASIEMHKGHLKLGSSVLIHDDLLTTGGTAEAAVKLVESEGGLVTGFHFIVTLRFLGGSERLGNFASSVLSGDRILNTYCMNFARTEQQEMIAQMVRDFAEKEVRPHLYSGMLRSFSQWIP